MTSELNFHKRLETLHVGCEKPHAYFIPFESSEGALSGVRDASAYFKTLCGEWSLRGTHLANTDMPDINIKATVPGCAQLDMAKAGILPSDLFMGENIKETEKYEDCEWWYERSFTAPKDISNAYLVFRGVDCVAEYLLNGKNRLQLKFDCANCEMLVIG